MRSKGLAHEHKRRPVICVYTMFANLSRRQPQRLRLRHAPQVLAVKRERGSCADVQSQIHGGRSEGGVTRLLCRSLPPRPHSFSGVVHQVQYGPSGMMKMAGAEVMPAYPYFTEKKSRRHTLWATLPGVLPGATLHERRPSSPIRLLNVLSRDYARIVLTAHHCP